MKKLAILWWILGLICPPIGIVLYFVFKKKDKEKSNNLIKGSIFGLCVYSLFILYLGTHSSDYFNRTVDEWYKDVSSNNTVVTVIGASYCSHCQEYKPHIKTLADKNNLNLYFYEIDTLSEEDENKLLNSFELVNYQGKVPYTVIFKDGQSIASHEGYESESAIYQFLLENGAI